MSQQMKVQGDKMMSYEEHLRKIFQLAYRMGILVKKHPVQMQQLKQEHQQQIKHLKQTIDEQQLQIDALSKQIKEMNLRKNKQLEDIFKNVIKSQFDNIIEQKIKIIVEKDNQIVKIRGQLQELKDKNIKLEIQFEQIQSKYQFQAQQSKIYKQLQQIVINDKKLRVSRNYNLNQQALTHGFDSLEYWNTTHNTTLNEDGWYLTIEQQLLNQQNIGAVHKLIKKYQWSHLQHLCFNPKALISPQQTNLINDELWEILTKQKDNCKFEKLKILNLCNHRILNISKEDFEAFPNLKLLDFRISGKYQSKEAESYAQVLKVLRSYALDHHTVKILATDVKGQSQQWYMGNIKLSDEIVD